MDFKKCENGHFYDVSVNSTCPMCAQVSGNSSVEDLGVTVPVTGGFTSASDVNNPGIGDEYTGFVDIGGAHGFRPAVGWLVSIDGPTRGRDYRIYPEYNFIGRSDEMDICITGDDQISREKHATIAYDDPTKAFYFAPADGRNIVRVNGKPVLSTVELAKGDIITIGSTKLIFVPLCGPDFSWTDSIVK